MSPTERLQKILAAAGIASRRASEEIIAAGRVQVNGRVVVEMGVQVDPSLDEIRVDGMPLPRAERHIYILLNKPVGVLSAASDERGRTTVLDLVPVHERVYPVGRLDVESEGLILLTNDGEMTERLTHPRYGHAREYRALVRGVPPDPALKRLRRGIQLEDGPTGPAEIEFIPEAVLRREKLPFAEEGASWLKVVIREGRKRQIRQMFEQIGHPVRRLIRVAIGPLALGDLPQGQYRFLTPAEVKALLLAAGQPERRGARGPRGRRMAGAVAVRSARRDVAEGPTRGRRNDAPEYRRTYRAADKAGRGAADPSDRSRTGPTAQDKRRSSEEVDDRPRKRRDRDDRPERPDRRSASRKALDAAFRRSEEIAAGRRRPVSGRKARPDELPDEPAGPRERRRREYPASSRSERPAAPSDRHANPERPTRSATGDETRRARPKPAAKRSGGPSSGRSDRSAARRPETSGRKTPGTRKPKR